jgi:tetratricopeptide (TPR) repeat protein
MFGIRRKLPAVGHDPAGAAPAAAAAQWRSRGNDALAQARLNEAADCYRRAMQADPSDPLARVNLGYVLLEAGDASQAVEALLQAIALAAGRSEAAADAHFLLGRAREALGQRAPAIASLRAALSARPVFSEASQELVRLLIAAGHAQEAVAVAHQSARAVPTAGALMLLAQALHAARRPEEALATLDSILLSEPDHLGALESRGNVLLESGRAQEALAMFERLMAAHGRQPVALANASAALLRLGRPAQALGLADEALRAQPQHRESLHNKVRALLDLLRVDEALQLSLQATRLYPQDADLRWNLAVAHLLLGDLLPGWQAYESRWQATGFGRAGAAPTFERPRWMGAESLGGGSIFLHAEQGLGDSIQFLRYVPLVAAQAREVLLQVQPALAPLASGLASNCRVLLPGESLPPTDWECPLLSLPAAFGTSLQAVPSAVPYLHAEAALAQEWASRLPQDGRRRVGIVWSGNPRHTNDQNRSLRLAAFRAFETSACSFVALQPEIRESDQTEFEAWHGLIDAGPSLRNFADTAALLQALDLVITVDTSVAHLAGALGRPVWILLPYAPDWRWMLDRADTPWYPTATLYRQPAIGAWAPVLERVQADLQRLVKQPFSRTIGA